jgi:hypothetical protein
MTYPAAVTNRSLHRSIEPIVADEIENSTVSELSLIAPATEHNNVGGSLGVSRTSICGRRNLWLECTNLFL